MEQSIYSLFFYDAVMTYLKAANMTINEGKDYKDGIEIFNAVRKIKFNGVTSNVMMQDGDRDPDREVFAILKNGVVNL